MADVSRKTSTSTSTEDSVSWDKNAQKWRVPLCFSNTHVKFKASLGLFGKKGDKSTVGQLEAGRVARKVKAQREAINERLKDVTDLAEFKRRVKEEIKKVVS